MNKLLFIILPVFLFLSACDDDGTLSGGPEDTLYCTQITELENGLTRISNGCGKRITVATASGIEFELDPGQSRDVQLQEGETIASCEGSRDIKFISLYEAECNY